MTDSLLARPPWRPFALALPGSDRLRNGLAAFALCWLAVAVATIILTVGGAHTLQDDAAQYASTAHHLLIGDGAATSILYYESQLEQGFPAAQTVWPAGMPLLAAATAFLSGLSIPVALIVVGLLAHLATAALLVWILRGLGGSWSLSWASAMLWLGLLPAWLGVVRGLADPAYQAFCLAGSGALLLALNRHKRSPARYWPAALAAALVGALAMRYQAVAMFMPTALAVWYLVGGWAGVRTAILVCLPAGMLLIAMFARNVSITGTLTGGAHSQRGQTLPEIASRIEWVAEGMRWPLLLLIIVCAVASLAIALRLALPMARHSDPDGSRVRTSVHIFGLSAFGSNLLLMIVLSLSSSVYVLEMRYVLAACLFVLPSLIIGIASIAGGAQTHLGTVILALLLLQIVIVWKPFEARVTATPSTDMAQLLAGHHIEGRPALAWLRTRAQEGQVMLSTHPHGLHLLSGGPAIGIPVPVYTRRPIDDETVRAHAKRLQVQWLVAFRQMKTWVYRDPVNQLIDRNDCPLWLSPVIDSAELLIARVNRDAVARCGRNAVPAGPSGLFQVRPVSSSGAGA